MSPVFVVSTPCSSCDYFPVTPSSKAALSIHLYLIDRIRQYTVFYSSIPFPLQSSYRRTPGKMLARRLRGDMQRGDIRLRRFNRLPLLQEYRGLLGTPSGGAIGNLYHVWSKNAPRLADIRPVTLDTVSRCLHSRVPYTAPALPEAADFRSRQREKSLPIEKLPNVYVE